MKLLKLVIVDDEPILLEGLLKTYDWAGMGFEVVGSARDGDQAIQVIKDKKPNVVLTDIRMKKVSGLQVMQEIEKEKIYCLFVVLSAYRDFEYAKQACDLGAFAYLLKPINDDELRQTMCGAYESCMGQIQNEEKLERWEDLIVKDKDTFLKVILQKTVEVYFNIIDSEKGSFPDYAPSTVVSFKGIAADTDQQFEIPAVKANDGYKFTGWKVEGAETQNWDADAKTFGVTGLAHFPEGSNVGYVTITPEFEKVEETPAVAVANATVVIDSNEGSFEEYEGTTELHNENLQDSKYNLGFLPTVVANEGYTFKGWKVTNKAGEEIYNLDANATSISFPYGVADDYTVTAVLEKNEEEVAVANATVVIDSVAGSFEGYEGATELHNENLQEAEYNLGFLPTVVANEGYTFKGWKVTNKAGEEIYNLDANATSISFPYGVADDYTVTAVLEKNETPVDPDQPSVDPSKPSTPEEKPGTSIEENKKDDKTSTTVAKDDKKTNKKESAKKANEQKSDTVQTGDHSNVFVYVATLLIAGAAAVVAFFRRRNA